MTVDVIQRGEALAVFERDLIIHFQQISRAAALYIRALLGGVKRALEVYRQVDDTTKNYPWSIATTEEKWHSHAERVLMVALTSSESPSRSLEKCQDIESSAKLSPSSDDVLSFVESCVECGRKKSDDLSPDSARRGSICYSGDNRLAKLDSMEVCGEKVGRDWWSPSYGYSLAPSFHQNPLEAFSRQQEGEFRFPKTVKYYPVDEPKPHRNRGAILLC